MKGGVNECFIRKEEFELVVYSWREYGGFKVLFFLYWFYLF